MDLIEKMEARQLELDELGNTQIKLLKELQAAMAESQEACDALLEVIRNG